MELIFRIKTRAFRNSEYVRDREKGSCDKYTRRELKKIGGEQRVERFMEFLRGEEYD